MIAQPQSYLVDREGNRVGVVLDLSDYQALLDDIEELESIRAYDAAKACGETAIPFEQAIGEIEREPR